MKLKLLLLLEKKQKEFYKKMLKIIFLDIVFVMISANVIGKKIRVGNGLKENQVILLDLWDPI